jgi:hypothetical protein
MYSGSHVKFSRQAANNPLVCLLASSAYLPTLKLEAVRSSETPINFYQTARDHILRDVAFTAKLFLEIIT